MTYPQSGSGYGQGDAGAQQSYGQQQYGQQSGYGQQDQYGQQQQAGYGQQDQYSQQQYGQQQYGQQGYGYQPQAPASQGLPANTPTILAGIIGGLGIIMLFCGFLGAYTFQMTREDVSERLVQTAFAAPYALLAVAAFLSLATFLLGTAKWVTGAIFALTGVAAFVTVFQFTTIGGGQYKNADVSAGVGAILLLVFSILAFIAAVVWLLVEGGQIKLAPAVGAPAAAAAATPAADASAQQYGYGQQAQAQQAPAQQATYGQADQAAQQYGQQAQQSYGQQAAQQSYGQPNSSPSNALPEAAANEATTAFQHPNQGQQQ